MLLEFSCSNHKSIGSEVTFSVSASQDTANEENLIHDGDSRVLKAAVIYGANGSGKSNLIDAMAFVKKMVTDSVNHQPGELINQTPHRPGGAGKESTYTVLFTAGGILYSYGFTLLSGAVTDEYLYYFPNGRPVCVFERDKDSFTAGYSFRGSFKTCKDVLKPSRLMLSCAANFSSVKEAETAYGFFAHDLVIYNPGNQNDWLDLSLHRLYEDAAYKGAVLEFMRSLDTGIQDIIIKTDKSSTKYNGSMLQQLFPTGYSMDNSTEKIIARVVYDEYAADLLTEESEGIRKLFGLACPLTDTIANGKVFICDGLESCLHESVVRELIRAFMHSDLDGRQAQIFFTTHDTSLIDTHLFRRDQIWFAEMDKRDSETDLYSLADLTNVRKEENYRRGYASGRYGAIPVVNIDFSKLVSKM